MKNVIFRNSIYFFVAFGCLSCGVLFEPEKLQTQKTSYNGRELRTDGYYYRIVKGQSDYYSIIFLYRDGVFLEAYPRVDEINEKENEFKNGVYYSAVKDNFTLWGLFTISENEISLERYYGTGGPGGTTGFLKGTILNDSTFVIKKFWLVDNIDVNENSPEICNDTLLFKVFSPKPDSINGYAK